MVSSSIPARTTDVGKTIYETVSGKKDVIGRGVNLLKPEADIANRVRYFYWDDEWSRIYAYTIAPNRDMTPGPVLLDHWGKIHP